MKKAIINTKIVLTESLIFDGAVLFDESGILDFGKRGDVPIPEDAELIDAGGHYTGPGFVDIHNHGGGGYWFHEDPTAAASWFLSHGQTTLLPTLYPNLSLQEMIDALDRIRKAMKEGAGRTIAGVYMEGPYLNPKYGADAKNNKWKGPLDPAVYEQLIDAGSDIILVWCLAPELEGIDDFITAVLKKSSPIFSIAHSEATTDQVFRFVEDGLILQTHHTNATGVKYFGGIRHASVDEAALLCDKIYIELIVDSMGVHVPPDMLRLAIKVKPKDKIIIITDSAEFNAPTPEEYKDSPDLHFDSEGGVAGSALTSDQACRNMMRHTGAGICDVFRYASYNPACLLGMQRQVGSIRKGADANIIIVDDTVNIKKVFFKGEEII